MRRIAFATWRAQPTVTADDRLAVEPLARRRVVVEAAVWSSPAVDWATYDAVVIRSTWDYHVRPRAFGRWLERLRKAGVPVHNAPDLVRWNLDKRYLAGLEERGVPVEPTVWIERGGRADLGRILADQGWEEAVVKPTVSASARWTWRTAPATAAADRPRFQRMLARGGVMVQRLNAEIRRAGEWSLVYLGGEYSHCVVKRPADGDFRVQEKLGGGTAPAEATAELVASGRAALGAAIEAGRSGAAAAGRAGDESWPLYARVDGIPEDGRIVVMEIELIEPSLFLGHAPDAPARFAEALAAAGGRGGERA